MVTSLVRRAVALVAAGAVLWTAAAAAAEIKVMSSGGFAAAYRNLAAQFERETAHKIVSAWGPSMGNTPQAIPNRVKRGEPVDVLIIAGDALDALIREGKVVPGSRVDLAQSGIGLAVRAGAPKPDISSVEALKRVLIQARSIACSDSVSGIYLSTVLFQRLGIADQIGSKSKMIIAEPVGEVVARGEAELGFQQISELIPVPGIDLVGPLPSEIQKFTTFSAGIAASTQEPKMAEKLIKFMASPAAAPR